VKSLRLLVYDATCKGSFPVPGLSSAWGTGARLYGALGRIDAARGVRNWQEALEFLALYGEGKPVREVQYWGHGTFGKIWIAKEALHRERLADPAVAPRLEQLAARFALAREGGHEPLFWIRTCETMGGPSGQAFAKALTRTLGCRVAGHTHVIGVLQSGLVALRPGEEPAWPADMGLGPRGEGGPGLPSLPGEPRTVHFLTGRLPETLR